MSIKVYRIKIEGYVVHQDFFSNSYTDLEQRQPTGEQTL